MTASSPALSVALALAFALAFALTGRSAEAQVCTGSTPFSNGNVRVGVGNGRIGAGFGSADGEPSLGFQAAVGASRGAFASAGLSAGLFANRFIREEIAASGVDDALSGTFSVSGGYSVSLPTSRHVEFCPIAGFGLQSGPSMWLECSPLVGGGKTCSGAVQGSARALWFGGNIGLLHRASPGVAFVPFAGASYVSSRIAGGMRSHTDGYVEVSLGAGLVVKRMTIRPTLSFPMGLEEGTRSLGLLFAFNIGPKRLPEGD